MSAQTAKPREIISLPFNSGDIVDGSFVDGSFTVQYKRIKNFYFDFCLIQPGGFQALFGATSVSSPPLPTLINDTIDHFAAMIGVTVNTYYPQNYSEGQKYAMSGINGAIAYWNGSTYHVSGMNGQNIFITGFLAN